MSTPQPKLDIRLLGGFFLELNQESVTGLPSRKAEALLAYLVSHKRPFPRETLADFLWDDRPQDQALANLRSVLSGLRRHLKPYFTITRQTVAFNHNSAYTLDVQNFLTRLDAGNNAEGTDALTPSQVRLLETAVSLYKGPFLAGFHLRESRRFDEWASLERERIQRLVITALSKLVTHTLHSGEYAKGIEHAVRLLEFDPLNESIHRQLMLLLARHGQRAAALRQYEACSRILEDELGVPPASETTLLYDQIRAAQTIMHHNLPPQSTPFVGRETELADLHRLILQPDQRCITLQGPGGIGKTRLALRVAELIANQQPGHFLHGIRFVPLHSHDSPQFLLTSIAETVGFQPTGTSPVLDQLATFLKQREMLLILDNLEQMIGERETVRILHTLLRQAPYLSLLITSRVRLNLPGEQVIDMRGLATPSGQVPVPLDQYSAVKLFLQTARQYRHGFLPSEADLQAIVRTCQLLDGIPLGIELAAAWVRLLSCADIAEGIEQDIDFLQQTGTAVTERHASLRAAFNRSWQLLDASTKTAVSHLSLFRSSFTREAALAVAEANLAILIRLLDQSWIRRVKDETTNRFTMLTVMRQYAAEKLADDPTAETAVQRRFINFMADWMADRLDQLTGGEQQQALSEINSEIEHVRQAVQLAISHQAVSAIGRLLDSLFHFYDTRSWFQEGATVFDTLVQNVHQFPASAEQPVVLAKLKGRLGWFRFHQGAYEESVALLEASIGELTALDERGELVFGLNYLAAVQRHLGQFDTAVHHLQQALTIARERNDRFQASIALNILGQIASLQGDFEQARQQCQEGLAIKRQIGDRWGMTHSLTYLGRVALAESQFDEARSLFEESLTISQSFGDRRGVAFAHQNLGDVALYRADHQAACDQYSRSLQLYQEIGDRLGRAITLAKIGQANALLDDPVKSRRQLVEALEVAQQLHSQPVMVEGVLGTAVLRLVGVEDTEEGVRRLRLVLHSEASSQAQKARAAHFLPSDVPEAPVKPAEWGALETAVGQIIAIESAQLVV